MDKPKYVSTDGGWHIYEYKGRTYVYVPEYGTWCDTTVEGGKLVIDKMLLGTLHTAMCEDFYPPYKESYIPIPELQKLIKTIRD